MSDRIEFGLAQPSDRDIEITATITVRESKLRDARDSCRLAKFVADEFQHRINTGKGEITGIYDLLEELL